MPDPNVDVHHPLRVVGRYALYGKLAQGGMATVHFGRLLGPVGFSRTVAIKRLHPEFAKDPEFVAMFLDEARLAARIQHPNVVATVDVVAVEEELFLVMDYIRGEAFSRIIRGAKKQNIQLPEGFIANVGACMLHGLHAAHDATDERGQPLHVVHRDVSPQNVLVGTDGVARVLDFGVAKAAARIQVTRDGQMKGKLAYMSPEQLSGVSVDRRSDVFAAGVVLWEALTGERLFTGDDVSQVLHKILRDPVPPPSSVNPAVRREVDAVIMRALDKNITTRYQTAREFAIAIEETMELMSPRAVGDWVERIAGDSLQHREDALAEIESISSANEFGGMTPSDVGFMRTLKTQVGAKPLALPLRPSAPGKAPTPPPRRPSAPGATPNAEAEEAATTIYHSSRPPTEAARRAHTPPPLPSGFRQSDPSTAVIVNDPPSTAHVDTGIHHNPFRTESRYKPYVVWAGGGMLAVGVLYLLFTALFTLGESSVEGAEASVSVSSETGKAEQSGKAEPKSEPKVAPEPEQKAEAVDLADLPIVGDGNEESDEPSPTKQSQVGKPSSGSVSTKKPASGGGKPKKGDCSQPWYVDAEGIRRIKSQCL